jgi:hypothetical protein
MAYDPYQSDASQGMTPGSIAGSLLNPINWYTSMPGWWSGTTGMWKPIGLRAPKFSEAAELWKSGSRFKAIGALNPITKSNGRWGKTLLENRRMIQGAEKRLTADLATLIRSRGGVKIKNVDLYKKAKGLYNVLEESIEKTGTADLSTLTEKIISPNALREEKFFLEQDLKKFNKSINVLEKIGKGNIGNTRFWGGVAKWGFRGMKVFSIASLATMAFELTTAIADPVGRAMVNTIDRGLIDLQTKYQSNMGGQLSMAYLNYGAATERHRALRAMSQSQINGRSAFGQEATYF